jgi:cation:H+ antiporter
MKSILTSLVAAKSKALSALWTFPSILIAALAIAWGAESAQFLISQGFVLAIISWLQTSPEFVVEGIIAWKQNITLMTANFTGATRLLFGFGMPTVFLTAYLFNLRSHKKHGRARHLKSITLKPENAVPVMGLVIPILYAVFIVIKASLHIGDAAALIVIYAAYLFIIRKIPPQEVESLEEMEPVPRFILTRPKKLRNLLILSCFLFGGTVIFFVAEPFLESMLALAVVLGLSDYFFVQWVAPFLSEFPEFISASYWARTVKKAPMALMNTVSSAIAELTLLVALIPIVYSFSRGEPSIIPFDHLHRTEILLTALQALLGFVLLANMEFRWYEALGLFGLWFFQLVVPHSREEIMFVYGFWILAEVIMAFFGLRKFVVFGVFKRLVKEHF